MRLLKFWLHSQVGSDVYRLPPTVCMPRRGTHRILGWPHSNSLHPVRPFAHISSYSINSEIAGHSHVANSAIILMMLYFVGGTLYRRYVLNIRGFDQLPRFSLFSLGDTIEFVQNVCDRFITSSRSQSWTNDYNHHTSYQSGRRQRGSVDRLPTLPEEEESLIGGDHENDHAHAEGHRAPPPQQVQPTPTPQTQVQQGTPDLGLGHANDGDAQPHPMDTQNVIRS